MSLTKHNAPDSVLTPYPDGGPPRFATMKDMIIDHHAQMLTGSNRELYLAWVDSGGDYLFSIDAIKESLICVRDNEADLIAECVALWMEKNSLKLDPRIKVDWIQTWECNPSCRKGVDIVEYNDRLYAFTA